MATPCCLEIRNDSKERFRLRGCQGRGRLVHDQDANVMRKRLRDLDDLLLTHAQIPHQGGGIQRLFESIKQFTRHLLLLSDAGRPRPV